MVPPTTVPAASPRWTSVRAAANSREASLYGFVTGVTDSTPGSRRSGISRSASSSPMQPMTTRLSPRDTCVRMPSPSTRSRMWSSFWWVMPDRVMMIMVPFESAGTKKGGPRNRSAGRPCAGSMRC